VVPLPISGDTSNINPEFPGRYRKPLSRLIWANMSSWNPKYGVQSHDSPKSSSRHGWPWPIVLKPPWWRLGIPHDLRTTMFVGLNHH
jgi:hypothetical protein